MNIKWTTQKPILDKECLLLTASKIGKEWDYSIWVIGKLENYETGGWYLGIMTGDGEEWGLIEDLSAHKYCILETLKT